MSLTETGFDRPRLLEIKSEYDSLFASVLGPVNTNADSVTGRYRDWETDRKSTRLNSSHSAKSRMPSSA